MRISTIAIEQYALHLSVVNLFLLARIMAVEMTFPLLLLLPVVQDLVVMLSAVTIFPNVITSTVTVFPEKLDPQPAPLRGARLMFAVTVLDIAVHTPVIRAF